MRNSDKRNKERARSSTEDYTAYGAALTRNDGTMNDMYGDGSDHEVCPICGMCVTCGDCVEYGCRQASNAPGKPTVANEPNEG